MNELQRRRRLILFGAIALALLGPGLRTELIPMAVTMTAAVVLGIAAAAFELILIRTSVELVEVGVQGAAPAPAEGLLKGLGGAGQALATAREALDRVLNGMDYAIVPLLIPMVATALGLVAGSFLLAALIWLVAGGLFYAVAWLDYLRATGRAKPGHSFLQESASAVLLVGLYLAALYSSLPQAGRLFYIGLGTALVAARAFVRARSSWTQGLVYGGAVGACVAAVGWIMGTFLVLPELPAAGILMLAWYPNQGLVEHTLAGDLNRNVIIEYSVFVLVALFLLVKAFDPSLGLGQH